MYLYNNKLFAANFNMSCLLPSTIFWPFPEVGKYLLKMTVMSRYLRIMLHATLTLFSFDVIGLQKHSPTILKY